VAPLLFCLLFACSWFVFCLFCDGYLTGGWFRCIVSGIEQVSWEVNNNGKSNIRWNERCYSESVSF